MEIKKMATKVIISTTILSLGMGMLPEMGSSSLMSGAVNQVEAASVKYKTTYKTTANLNLRSGASTKHKVLVTIPKGKAVSYVSKSGSWTKVKYGSKTGFVSTKYLKSTKVAVKPVAKPKPKPAKKPVAKPVPKATATKTTYTTTAGLNLRSGASTKHKVLLTIPKGKTVAYVSKSGSWSKVKYGSKTGFVSTKYLKTTKVAVKPKPKPAAKPVAKPTPKPTTKPVKKPVVKATVYKAPSVNTPGKYVGGILIVNKTHKLPSTYNPGVSSLAKKGLNDMIADAKKSGVTFSAISSFRTYSYQTTLYNNYVKKHGKAKADRFSARPGHSEHQTGLTFDLGGTNKKHWLEESFAETKEGKWLNANAHKYGFILRYPKGKEKITGYQFEPWHFRYIGSEKATQVKSSGKTLEEYLNIVGK